MRQIIAMGGGGFSMEPENLALDRYILDQVGKPRPKICFLPTASGDGETYIQNFFKAFTQLECRPSFLSLFALPSADLETYVLEKDIIYVGGGNTRSMMALWREWGLDAILGKAYDAGAVLAGLSAGANCWFEQCTTDSMPGELNVLNCLGLLQGSFCPHYDGEALRRPSFHQFIREGRIKPGFAADDSAAAHFVDEQLVSAISSCAGKQVYRVSKQGDQVIEEAVETRCLV